MCTSDEQYGRVVEVVFFGPHDIDQWSEPDGFLLESSASAKWLCAPFRIANLVIRDHGKYCESTSNKGISEPWQDDALTFAELNKSRMAAHQQGDKAGCEARVINAERKRTSRHWSRWRLVGSCEGKKVSNGTPINKVFATVPITRAVSFWRVAL